MKNNIDCNNCYWWGLSAFRNDTCFLEKENTNNDCLRFDLECEACQDEVASYTLDNKAYCEECLKKELGIQTYTITHYSDTNGEYLGSEDDNLIDLLQRENEDIKELD